MIRKEVMNTAKVCAVVATMFLLPMFSAFAFVVFLLVPLLLSTKQSTKEKMRETFDDALRVIFGHS